jgi:signal transduction histidine kinase
MIHRARLRLTAWYAAIFVAMLVVLGAAAYLTMRRTLMLEVDRGVQTVVDGLRSTELDLDDRARGSADPRREYHAETADVFVLLLRADGRVVSNPSQVDTEDLLPRDLVRAAQQGRSTWTTVEVDHQHLRLYAAPVMRRDAVAGVVVGGRSLSAVERDLNALLITLAAAGGVGTLMAMGGGYLLAGRALRPIAVAYERQRRFVGDASHELRSPLAVIRASSELLLREPLTAPQQESITEIRDTSIEASALVDDLLTLARLDHDRPRPSDEPCDLGPVTADVLDQLQPLLAAHGTEVTRHLAGAVARWADLDVRRVLRALIENVIAHTPAGTAAEVATGVEGGFAVLRVRDHGPGVPRDALDTLFERFTRVDVARTPGSGSGLGLAIVAGLVRRAGGTVVARNAAGGGLEVEVRLPAA